MTSAHQVAARYDRYAAVVRDGYGTAHWRRELAAVRAFMTWIESFWWDDAPPEPATGPDAVSADAGLGPVRWYDSGGTVLGYAPGLDGCYQVPAADAPPALGRRPAVTAA